MACYRIGPYLGLLSIQLVLLGKSNICTIHSFCLEVIKNNFFEINLSANFRIGSEEEILLLKQEVLDDLFEKWKNAKKDFIDLMNGQLIYEWPEPVSFELSEKDKERLKKEMLEEMMKAKKDGK